MAAKKALPAQMIRTGDGQSGYTYVAASPEVVNLPIAEIDWFAVARFANWLHNGQPHFDRFKKNPGTETEAYKLKGRREGLFRGLLRPSSGYPLRMNGIKQRILRPAARFSLQAAL